MTQRDMVDQGGGGKRKGKFRYLCLSHGMPTYTNFWT